jgi:accessory gene regulator B
VKLTNRLTGYLEKELNLTRDQVQVINYGLLSLAATGLNLLVLLILGALLGVVRESLFIALVVMALRKTSGGAHSDTLPACIATGTTALTACALITRFYGAALSSSPLFLAAAPAAALLAVCLYAPADVPQKPIKSPKQRRILRFLSFLFIAVWTLLGIYLWLGGKPWLYYYAGGNLGILWQTLMLTPAGYHLMRQTGRLSLIIRR